MNNDDIIKIANLIELRFIHKKNEWYEPINLDDKIKTILLFLSFMGDCGYSVKPVRKSKKHNYLTLKEIREECVNKIELYKDGITKQFIMENLEKSSKYFKDDSSAIILIFLKYINEIKKESFVKKLNSVSIEIFIFDEFFFFLDLIHYRFIYNNKNEKYNLIELIKQHYKQKYTDEYFVFEEKK